MLRYYSWSSVCPTVQQHLFGQDPTMSIQGTDAETQGKIIILIAYLLKFVETTFPECARLYFSTLPSNNPVSITIR